MLIQSIGRTAQCQLAGVGEMSKASRAPAPLAGSPGLAWLAIATALWSGCCHASYGQFKLDFPPEFMFAAAAIIALPTSGLCVLAEILYPRRSLPAWLTSGATIAALLAFGVAFVPLNVAAGALLVLPPLATLALRGRTPRPLPRLAAGCAVSILAVSILAVRLSQHEDTLVVLAGGATSCLGLWIPCVLILRRKGWVPTGGAPLLPALMTVLPPADLVREAGERVVGTIPALERTLSAHRGIRWWLATSIVLFAGIGVLIGQGGLARGSFLYTQAYSFLGVFGLPMTWVDAHTAWWKIGLPWSLLVGSAAWGVAGLVGGSMDMGRPRVLRFAAVVFGCALLFWSVTIVRQTNDAEAAEREVTGFRP